MSKRIKPEMWHSLGGLRGELQRRLEAAPQVRMVRIVSDGQ